MLPLLLNILGGLCPANFEVSEGQRFDKVVFGICVFRGKSCRPQIVMGTCAVPGRSVYVSHCALVTHVK